MRKASVVVVVEDNPDDREFFSLAVKSTGFDVDLVFLASGEEALDYVRRTGKHADRPLTDIPDVVFLDVNLDRMFGFDVLHAIRFDVTLRLVPVVMYTSSISESDVRLAYEQGASGYLQKSQTLDEAKERARVILTYWLSYNVTTKTCDYSGSA